MKKLTASLILASMLVSLAACGGETPDVTPDATTDNPGTTAEPSVETNYTRENTPDSLPELDFKNATVRIAYRGDETVKLVEYEGSETGDVVSDAVYNRNRAVEERLNVKLEFISGDPAVDPYMGSVRTSILAGEDLYDIVGAVQWHAAPQSIEGLYKNLIDAPYIDYSKPWWSNDYMDTLQVSPENRYLLSGDISVWQLRSMSCVYFNKRLYEDSFGDPDDLYTTVMDGKWTYELLSKYVKDVWQDLDGDGKTSAGDILGIGSTPISQTDHFVYTAGLKFIERDKDGYPTLIKDQSRNVRVTEAIYDLYYETPGTLIYPAPSAMENELVKHFNDGNMLFYPNRFYSTEKFREMKDAYGIIPFPKLDETQEKYYALVHDSTTLYCVPVTVSDLDLPCAVLEAMCAENYRTVTPAYYEVALKVKYTRDDISSQIIDMIHENVRTDFAYVNNNSFTTQIKIGSIERSLMGMDSRTPSKDFMSLYDSIKDAAAKDLQNIIEKAKANVNN